MSEFLEYIVMPLLALMGIIFLVLMLCFGVHQYNESNQQFYRQLMRQEAIGVLQYQQQYHIIPSQ